MLFTRNVNLEYDIQNIFNDEKNAKHKLKDMNNRLYKIYEEIYLIGDQVSDYEQRKDSSEQENLIVDNIYIMLLYFDEFFDKINLVDKPTVLSSMIKEVHL